MTSGSPDYLSPECLADYQDQVRRYARHRGLNHEAGEIAQESIARLLENQASLDLSTSPLPWVMRVAGNLCTDIQRFQGRVLPSADTSDTFREPPASPSALDALLREERDQTVRDALRQLHPNHELVVRMRYMLGMTYEEISELVGIPINTLRQHVHRAKRKLAMMLEDLRTFGLLVLLRLRIRRPAVPADFPVVAATAFANLMVPLMILAGVAAGGAAATGTAPAGAPEAPGVERDLLSIATRGSVIESSPASAPVKPRAAAAAPAPARRPYILPSDAPANAGAAIEPRKEMCQHPLTQDVEIVVKVGGEEHWITVLKGFDDSETSYKPVADAACGMEMPS